MVNTFRRVKQLPYDHPYRVHLRRDFPVLPVSPDDIRMTRTSGEILDGPFPDGPYFERVEHP